MSRRVASPSPTPESLLLPTSAAFLHQQGLRRGNEGGLIFADRRHTFGELAREVDAAAAWLAARGIGRRDHVAVSIANSPAIVATSYALWEVGAVTVPISIRSTVDELTNLLRHSRAVAMVCDEPREGLAAEATKRLGLPLYVVKQTFPLTPRIARRARHAAKASVGRSALPHPDDLAVLAYTSGTTGAPKGVMIRHRNLLWSALACATARGDSAASVGASISPLTHTPVFVSHLLCRLLLGSTTVLFDGFNTASLLEATERYRITDLPLIAGMVFDVVNLRRVPDLVRNCVQKVSVGGAATPMEAKRALADIFGGAEIIEAYGQSESTNGVAMARAGRVFEHPGTVGCMNPHVIVAVRRSDGQLADVDADGELVIGGPTVMAGYYRDKAATAATIRDGWLHTGDLGRRDAEGFFYITGRVKNLIITGGENVSPVEVEDVLRTHPSVADVAVIGTPHPKWGEQVTAVIVVQSGAALDREVLLEFAAKRLAGFKKPRRVEFVEALPRNAANKVQTAVLKEQFA